MFYIFKKYEIGVIKLDGIKFLISFYGSGRFVWSLFSLRVVFFFGVLIFIGSFLVVRWIRS